ncbi:cyclin-h [Anaeramoeba flamelloides]|uniref:Cyclin-h n=1 Tax=Anaeramoeba flamelloides TaxID=1746091 RepID=A0ABQ8XMU7_9EUKA|nr:cyclin-h [Anaeramoeba flamelloides]
MKKSTYSNALFSIQKNREIKKNIPTSEECELVIQYWASRIITYCEKYYKFPEKVGLTSSIFLKRFYLNCSPIEHFPSKHILSIIFLACKAEDQLIESTKLIPRKERGGLLLRDLGKQNCSASVIKQNEIIVLENLKFNLVVYTPLRSMFGVSIDALQHDHIRQAEDLKVINKKNKQRVLTEIYTKCKKAAALASVTDCGLLYTPSQIAIAILQLVLDTFSPNLCLQIEKYLPNTFEKMISKVEDLKKEFFFIKSQLPSLPFTQEKLIQIKKAKAVFNSFEGIKT